MTRAVDAGPPSTAQPCAPFETAPDLPEPTGDEKLHLFTRDDSGSADRTEASLDELAGAGAAIVIAGLDAQTATRALRWSDAHGVPVIAIVAPDADGPADAGLEATAGPAGFGFVLGERRERVLEVLARNAPTLVGPDSVVVPLIDTGESSAFPSQGGPLGPLTLGPPVSCDMPPVLAGAPRFPLGQWDTDRRHAWLVSGSPECAMDLTAELSEAHARGVVALALEAAALPAHAPSLRVITASAGVVPSTGTPEGADGEGPRFEATLGRISWWTALGRDAATLARIALRQLSTDTATEAPAVGARRAQARDLLAASRARLWSTEATGWPADHRMRRTLCAIEAPGASGRSVRAP